MGFTLERLGFLVLGLLAVSVGISILFSVDRKGNDMHPVENSIRNSDYPVCQEFEEGQIVGKEGFRTLFYGRYLEVCESQMNRINLGFELNKKYIDELTSDLSDNPKVLYRDDCSRIPGLNGVIIEESESEKLGGFEDEIILNGTENLRVCQ
jgi:hypothetical protein